MDLHIHFTQSRESTDSICNYWARARARAGKILGVNSFNCN